MSIVATFRERLLALGTGGFAGIVVSYYASRDIWQHAHDHGVLIDSTIEELRDLQGYERPPPPQARAPLKPSGVVAPLVRAQLGPRCTGDQPCVCLVCRPPRWPAPLRCS